MEEQEKYLLDFNVKREDYKKAISFIRRIGYPQEGEFHFLQEKGEVSLYYTLAKRWFDNFSPLSIKIKLSEVQSQTMEWVTFLNCFFNSHLENITEEVINICASSQMIAIINKDSTLGKAFRSTSSLKKEITLVDTGKLTPILKIKKGLLQELLLSLSFSTSEDPRRGNLYGIQLEKKDEFLIGVSTNGSMISEKKIPLSEIDLFDLDILYLIKENIDPLLFSLEGNPEDLVEFFQSEKNVLQNYSLKRDGSLEREESHLRNEKKFLVIQMDNIQFISSYSSTSHFPNYKRVMDVEKELIAIVSSFELERALTEVKGEEGSSLVFLQGKEGNLVLSGDSSLLVQGREGSHTENNFKACLDKNNLIPFLFSLKKSEALSIFITQEKNNSYSQLILESQSSRFLVAQAR